MAARRMKEAYDKGELPLMRIGDMAYLDARNLKEKIQEKDKPTRAMTRKLRKKRIGPFQLQRKLENITTGFSFPKKWLIRRFMTSSMYHY